MVINPHYLRWNKNRTSALTTRGLKENDFLIIGNIHRLIELAVKIQEISGKKFKDFMNILKSIESKEYNDINSFLYLEESSPRETELEKIKKKYIHLLKILNFMNKF